MISIITFMILVVVAKVHEFLPLAKYMYLVKLAIPVGIIGQLCFSQPTGPGFQPWRKPWFFFWLLTLWMVLGIPTSLWPSATVMFMVTKVGTLAVMMMLIIRNLQDIRSLEKTTLAVVASVLLIGLMSVVSPKTQIDWDGRVRLTVSDTFDSNDLAVLVAMAMPILCYWLRRASYVVSFASLAGLGLGLYVIYKTSSRGGMLSVGVLYLYMIFFVKETGIFLRGFLCLMLVVGGFAFTQTTTFASFVKGVSGQDYNASAEEGRLKVWQRGLGYVIGRPITGVGVARFGDAEGTMSGLEKKMKRGIKWSEAHNSFLQVAAETGVPGLTFFLLMIFACFREIRNVRRNLSPYDDDREAHRVMIMSSMVRCSLLQYMVGGFFLSLAYLPMLYLMVAYATALGNIADNLIEDIEDEREFADDEAESEAAEPFVQLPTDRTGALHRPPNFSKA